MKREITLLLSVLALVIIFLFLPESPPHKRVTMSDDFFTLLGKQTETWRFIDNKTDLEHVERFHQVYEKNKHFQFENVGAFKIPEVIHFIWLGPNNFPRESVENVRTWMVHHPNWKIKFWTDRDRPPPCKGMEVHYIQEMNFTKLGAQYAAAKNWAEKSDILRYEILFQEGGVYVDHDANCLRPFHSLHKGYDFYACLELPHMAVDNHSVTAGIGILGSRPEHPIVQGCLDLVAKRWKGVTETFKYNDPTARRELVLHRTYMALTHSLQEHLDRPGNTDIVFPASYFYAKRPLPSFYSQHFYGGKWEEKKEAGSPLLDKVHVVRMLNRLVMKTQVGILLFAFLSVGLILYMRKKRGVGLSLLLASMLMTGCGSETQQFEKLMGSMRYVETEEDRSNLEFFEKHYAQHHTFLKKGSGRIPKVIHVTWFGPHSFPGESKKNILSWIKRHPDWKVKFWSDRPRKLPHKNAELALTGNFSFRSLGKYFVEASTYREKADILRYEILLQEGGLCVDHDVECFRSFEPLVRSYDFFCGLHAPHQPILSTSVLAANFVMGAIPNHPIMQECVQKVADRWDYISNAYSRETKESMIYRIAHRDFSPFHDAVREKLGSYGNRDIVFPVAYFQELFSHPHYGSIWLDGETKSERNLKKRVDKLMTRSRQILVINGLIFCINLFLFIALLSWKQRAKDGS